MGTTKNGFMDLGRCASELGISKRWMRKLFQKTGFLPVLIINSKRFYLRHDFERWKKEHHR